jgi:CheY-like chemotaxis protein
MNHNQTIALVEDNDDDVFAMKRALVRARIINPLEVLTDGQIALNYLVGKNSFANRDIHPLPFIIFLDLKLPFVDGFEILEWIRTDASLGKLPVVVLTSSPESRDYARAYALGARSYLVKPPTAEVIRDVIDSLGSFWMGRTSASPVPNYL